MSAQPFVYETFVHEYNSGLWQNQEVPAPRQSKETHITAEDPGSLLISPLHLLRRALQSYTAHWQAVIPELTAPQYAVLLTVRDEPGVDQSRLSELTRIDMATLTPVMVRLEERGLIARNIDPHNKRRKVLTLTSEGRELVARIDPLVQIVDEIVLGELTSPQIETLIHALRSIAAHSPRAEAANRRP